MKIVFSVVFWCLIESSSLLAFPASEKDVNGGEDSTKIKSPIENEEVVVSSYYVPTAGIGIHKYHNAQKKNWNDARNTCLNEGGHLAVINSAAEEALIIKYMTITGNTTADQLWIGVHELFKKDEWVSVKDERLDAIGYAHWAAGQPDNAGSNEHCLTITQLGLNDYVCDEELFYVCEM